MTHTPRTLDELRAACEEQLRRFEKTGNPDTTACVEILRRAAAYDEEALNMLLGITATRLLPRPPRRLTQQAEDWRQEALLIIGIKLRDRQSPYVVRQPPPAPMAAYRAYVKLVWRGITFDHYERERRQTQVSLDMLHVQSGFEPADPGSENAVVHRRMRLDRLMALIPDPLDREIFRLRFVLQLKPDEIVEHFAGQLLAGQPVTKVLVFRSVERTIAALSKIPEVRDMFEDDEA